MDKGAEPSRVRSVEAVPLGFPPDDYLAKTSRSATTFLQRWQGAEVTVRELTLSLRVLVLVLFRTPGEMASKNLCIHVPDPLWMTGPFSWSDAGLSVSVVPTAESEARGSTSYDSILELRDEAAGFVLLADAIETKENVRLR